MLMLAQATESTTQARPEIATYIGHACIVAAAAIILFVLFNVYRRSRAGKPPLSDMPEAPLPTGTVQEAERLLKLMGEAEEQAARLSSDLTERTSRLERLIIAADQRLSALQAHHDASPRQPVSVPPSAAQNPLVQQAPRIVTRPIDFAPAASQSPPSTPASPVVRNDFPTTPDTRLAADARALRDQLTAIEARLQAVSVDTAPTRQAATPSRAVQVEGSSESLATAIYRLSDQGLAAAQIAQHLGQQTGTIELFLALRQG